LPLSGNAARRDEQPHLAWQQPVVGHVAGIQRMSGQLMGAGNADDLPAQV